jgi:hypothetical protein
LQEEGVDYFETYAPVVEWSTVRMLLTMVLQEGWNTKQVYYTNAFAQAELDEEVYVEPPKLFEIRSGKDLVVKLLKSLYGLKQSPRTFFEKLREGLLERGFTQSEFDLCLFMKKGIICVVYVDDTIFAGPDRALIDAEIKGLGVSSKEKSHSFYLRDEGEVGDFLGIRITKNGPITFELTETGLINKVLTDAGLEECRGVSTPAETKALGSDLEGSPFDKEWDYASVIEMLMYLSANTRPDIALAVHQAALFTHHPRASHSAAIKRILRYLKSTKDKGLFMSPGKSLKFDCYVDSDFGGLFAVEDGHNPMCAKSRTGYVLLFSGVPILWVSKMQTQISLSTMESEYIALSQSMRDLIPVREILKEIKHHMLGEQDFLPKFSSRSKAFKDATGEEDIPQSTVYEDNAACLQMARMPKLSPRTKNIAIPLHWYRSKVLDLSIEIQAIGTGQQWAYQYTKGLCAEKIIKQRKAIQGW